MPEYDVAVVGMGAAGAMAALRAGLRKKNVIAIERNAALGKKLLLTGGGKCNITNTVGLDELLQAFGKKGAFYRQAFGAFSNQDLIDFFTERGLVLCHDDAGRVVPKNGGAAGVVAVFAKALARTQANVLYDTRVSAVKKERAGFRILGEKNIEFFARSVVLSTGGITYKATGSSGDGYRIARDLGHTVIDLLPGLVPLKLKEQWPKTLQGISLPQVRIAFEGAGARSVSPAGEILFTHFGISGPLALDVSGRLVAELVTRKEITVLLDLYPGSSLQEIEAMLLKRFSDNRKMQVKNALREWPARFVVCLLREVCIAPDTGAGNVSTKQRMCLAKNLKALPMTVLGPVSVDAAMVTAGGVCMKEIDPRTMESRIVPGVYFAGEIIEGSAISGGFNLQQAFSTGFLAGEHVGR